MARSYVTICLLLSFMLVGTPTVLRAQGEPLDGPPPCDGGTLVAAGGSEDLTRCIGGVSPEGLVPILGHGGGHVRV